MKRVGQPEGKLGLWKMRKKAKGGKLDQRQTGVPLGVISGSVGGSGPGLEKTSTEPGPPPSAMSHPQEVHIL